MATVNKDFKIKSGLIVEGANGTINGYNILTESQDSIDFIVDTIGGTATSLNTPNTVVKRDGSGNFAAGTITADIVGNLTGNANTATALETARTIELTGDVTGFVSFDGTTNVQITATVDGSFATDTEVATAKQEAIDAAALDASTKADAAETAANLYTDGRETAITAAYEAYADQAETDARAYADSLATNYDAAGSAATAEANANDYTDTKVAALVDGAPELLDTLNELAAAIADNPNYATDVANLVATKADSTYVDSQDVYYDGLAQGYANTAETNAESYADGVSLTAENNAKSYADGLATNYDPAGSAATAETNANIYTDNSINALDTDDIEEGANNLYFTDGRAKDSAAALLTGANLTNITITGTGNGGLTITAENGVADSDTDDLQEGSTNLYFTDQRAVDALEAVVPNFTEIDVNSVATQVAATQTVAVASQVVAYSFDSNSYRSAKFLVKVSAGVHTELSEVLVTLDTSDNIAITEYAMVGTNGTLGTITADISTPNVELRVTTLNNNSVVTVFGTLLV
jgi:hypothetical protein